MLIDGARNCYALLLANRNLAGVMVQAFTQSNPLQKSFGKAAVDTPAKRHGQQNILEAGVALKQVEA